MNFGQQFWMTLAGFPRFVFWPMEFRSEPIYPFGSNPAQVAELSFPSDFHWRVIMPIRIVLADDHVLVRQGLKSLLEREKFQVVAEASDGQDAVRLSETHHPDIVVLDISMPTLNGIDAARELSRSSAKTKVILL